MLEPRCSSFSVGFCSAFIGSMDFVRFLIGSCLVFYGFLLVLVCFSAALHAFAVRKPSKCWKCLFRDPEASAHTRIGA